MSWLEQNRALPAALALALALALGGCFQPLYGEVKLADNRTVAIADLLRDIEIPPIDGRVSQEVRNDLIFELTGGDGTVTGAPYRLNLTVSTGTSTPSIVDPTTGIAAVDVVALTVSYRLHDVANNKALFSDQASARVTVDRSLQRFARVRGVREAENRAAKVVAQQIRTRLAAYFLTRS